MLKVTTAFTPKSITSLDWHLLLRPSSRWCRHLARLNTLSFLPKGHFHRWETWRFSESVLSYALQVDKYVHPPSGQFLAVKTLTTDKTHRPFDNIAHEIGILSLLRHENVVELVDVFHGNSCVKIVMECMDMSLHELIYAKPPGRTVNAPAVKRIMRDLLNGTKFVHQLHILHRDIKPHNLLFDRSGRLKLADFGSACTFCISPPRRLNVNVVTL